MAGMAIERTGTKEENTDVDDHHITFYYCTFRARKYARIKNEIENDFTGFFFHSSSLLLLLRLAFRSFFIFVCTFVRRFVLGRVAPIRCVCCLLFLYLFEPDAHTGIHVYVRPRRDSVLPHHFRAQFHWDTESLAFAKPNAERR